MARSTLAAIPLVTIAALGAPAARADEGGTAFWLSGQFASLAAAPPTPGWSFNATPYLYRGTTPAGPHAAPGQPPVPESVSRSAVLYAQVGYAFDTKVLGGTPFIALGSGWGWSRTTVQFDPVVPALQLSAGDSVTGPADVTPWASLNWVSGNDNWLAYVTGNLATAPFNASRLVNIGMGHDAIDAGAGYTYSDAQSGHEFSAVLGVTWNRTNPATNYKSGIDSHLDFAASRNLTANWQVGIAGYVYCQLTGDSGSGATQGPNKARIAGIGPELGYVFSINREQGYLNLRGYGEFWASNRPQGYALIATVNIPFGGK